MDDIVNVLEEKNLIKDSRWGGVGMKGLSKKEKRQRTRELFHNESSDNFSMVTVGMGVRGGGRGYRGDKWWWTKIK